MSTTLREHTDSTGPISSALIALDHAEHSAEHWSRIRQSARPPTRLGNGTHSRVGSAEAERDAATRARHVAALTELIDGTDTLPRSKRDELAGVISTKPHLKRYLRHTPGGLLRVDQAAIARETNPDGR